MAGFDRSRYSSTVPVHFCFRCGSLQHMNYQCQVATENASGCHKIFLVLQPKIKKEEDKARADKYLEKLQMKNGLEAVPWYIILGETERLIDKFRDVETLLDRPMSVTLSVATEVMEYYQQIEQELHETMRCARLVVAAGKEKLKDQSSASAFELEGYRGKLLDVQELRDRIWSRVARLVTVSRDVCKSVKEMWQVALKLSVYVEELGTYLTSNPDNPNWDKIDRQYYDKKTEIQWMKQRLQYIMSFGVVTDERSVRPAQMIETAELQLEEVRRLRLRMDPGAINA